MFLTLPYPRASLISSRDLSWYVSVTTPLCVHIMSKRPNSCTAIVLAGYWDDDGKIESHLPKIAEALCAFEEMSIDGTGKYNPKENNHWGMIRMEAQRDQAASRRRSRMAREHV